ncbi:MAG: alpha/beta hydrolase [Devosia sp.]|nr:alpha/beta hydrolase [Devosia sp.]
MFQNLRGTPAAAEMFALDPDIRRFVNYLTGAQGSESLLPPSATELRRIMAKRRQPLNRGGPVMAATSEAHILVDGIVVRLRIHRPAGVDGSRAMVYLHGGGWTIGSVDTHDRLMREYAAVCRSTVVGVDYSLAPEKPFPAALDECLASVRWLRSGDTLPPPKTIVVGGDSAGASLALGACLRLRDAGEPPVAAALLAYGAYDPDMTSASHRAYATANLILSGDRMRFFWDSYLQGPAARSNAYAAPLAADLSGLPPTFVLVADHDILRDENLALSERLIAGGSNVRCSHYVGTVHCFLEAVGSAAISRRAIAEQANWLNNVLGAT